MQTSRDTPLAAVPRLPAIPRPLGLGLLFAGAAALSGVTLLSGIQPNDEGLMLQAAARIADGQVPYRDFWWFYPPGQPYLLGGLWAAFGPSLLTWRIVRVLTDAAVAVMAYALARRAAPRRVALVAWLASALAMAYPTGPHPFPLALAFALGALLSLERSPALAGLLAGACAAWRIEFAAYLGLGVLLALALRPAPAPRARPAATFAGSALATGAALLGPVVAAAGLGRSWDLLVRYPVRDFSDYQSLPFPLRYDGPLNTGSIGGFLSDSAENLLAFYLPLMLVVGLAGALVALAARFERSAWQRAGAAVFAVGMAHYLLVRPDLFHTAPLAVMGSILAAWAIGGARDTGGRERSAARMRATALATALAAASLAYLVAEGADRRVLVLTDDTARLRLPVADGVRAGARAAPPLEAAVSYVRERVPPGAPIYVATRRADLVTAGHPLFYVLAQRPNPTRYDIQAPGVVTEAPAQREIVRDLARTRPALVVRWTDRLTAAPEPNRAGVSSGVRVLDRYLAARYRPAARFGAFLILERRS